MFSPPKLGISPSELTPPFGLAPLIRSCMTSCSDFFIKSLIPKFLQIVPHYFFGLFHLCIYFI